MQFSSYTPFLPWPMCFYLVGLINSLNIVKGDVNHKFK